MRIILKIFFFLLIFSALLVMSGVFYRVYETEQIIITQFGEPMGEPVITAGLKIKIPFIQKINRIEKRILEWDGRPNDMPTKDKLYISVDTFGRWRINDPLRYFRRLRDERSAQSRLEDILGSETRNAVAKHNLIEIIRTDKDRKPVLDETLKEKNSTRATLPPIYKGRHKIEEDIFKEAGIKLSEFGIELLDVRFKRINYNERVRGEIYARMISERKKIADLFRSEGAGEAARILGKKEYDLKKITSEAYKEIQKIEGVADAKATEIYASAYNQSPEAIALYEFIKTMETYKQVVDDKTTLLLSTESDMFKFLKRAGP